MYSFELKPTRIHQCSFVSVGLPCKVGANANTVTEFP